MKADTITKDFIRDEVIFADLFNQYIYGGEQVILPERLKESDPTELSLPYGEDGAIVPVQKFRDVRKLYAAKTDGKSHYIVYGVESQREIHYAMPVRNNLYDALAYAGQAEEAARSHRRAKRTEKNLTRGEFLGGFWKEDRLIPVMTLTISSAAASSSRGSYGRFEGKQGRSGHADEDALAQIPIAYIRRELPRWEKP